MASWVDRNPLIATAALLFWLFCIFLVFFMAAGHTVGAPAPAPAPNYPEQLPPSEHDARIVALDKEAIEAAYREHVQRMYSGWMKDDAGQPNRALTGVRQAQRAYIQSMDAIKKREEELQLRRR